MEDLAAAHVSKKTKEELAQDAKAREDPVETRRMLVVEFFTPLTERFGKLDSSCLTLGQEKEKGKNYELGHLDGTLHASAVKKLAENEENVIKEFNIYEKKRIAFQETYKP